ncbi:hypothetical protein E2L06_07805 [Haloterrigena sp. H1]|uniref:hypothetical protein n=1 Tax=Haloterrigena sp. H1 TaxID=2552943 RepID=UPI00110EE9BE|nr:hypothetical protein [Haloterrigena sp. H1]TMT86509.1 hypothetical protein E2L06_07805 [Haloterrigena sp. H1]
MERRRFLACASAAVAGTVGASGPVSASDGDPLTVEVVRHASIEPTNSAIRFVFEGVRLFTQTWTDATPGSATVDLDVMTVADFDIEPSYEATLDAIEVDDALGADRTPETVTLFVIDDGRASAGAMRSYAGDDGRESGAPGAYGYVNTALGGLFGAGVGMPRPLIRNFTAHECGHAVLGWAEFPHYPADATIRDPSPGLRAHSCGAQDHPAASGWFVNHGITVMATGYSARESRNTPREHRFATEQGAVSEAVAPVGESWSYINMDYVPTFSQTARAAMGDHYRQFIS